MAWCDLLPVVMQYVDPWDHVRCLLGFMGVRCVRESAIRVFVTKYADVLRNKVRRRNKRAKTPDWVPAEVLGKLACAERSALLVDALSWEDVHLVEILSQACYKNATWTRLVEEECVYSPPLTAALLCGCRNPKLAPRYARAVRQRDEEMKRVILAHVPKATARGLRGMECGAALPEDWPRDECCQLALLMDKAELAKPLLERGWRDGLLWDCVSMRAQNIASEIVRMGELLPNELPLLYLVVPMLRREVAVCALESSRPDAATLVTVLQSLCSTNPILEDVLVWLWTKVPRPVATEVLRTVLKTHVARERVATVLAKRDIVVDV